MILDALRAARARAPVKKTLSVQLPVWTQRRTAFPRRRRLLARGYGRGLQMARRKGCEGSGEPDSRHQPAVPSCISCSENRAPTSDPCARGRGCRWVGLPATHSDSALTVSFRCDSHQSVLSPSQTQTRTPCAIKLSDIPTGRAFHLRVPLHPRPIRSSTLSADCTGPRCPSKHYYCYHCTAIRPSTNRSCYSCSPACTLGCVLVSCIKPDLPLSPPPLPVLPRLGCHPAARTIMQLPTCTGIRIRTMSDAHVIFHAVSLGMLPMVSRRLDIEERRYIHSGCVCVWEERSASSSGESSSVRTAH